MKYTCIKQHDITDCAAACLATISRQYGLKLPISRIREIAGTDKMGTNAYGVVQAAEQLGFTAKGVKGDQNAFFSDFPLPCIAHVVTLEGLLHYVVIHKITRKQVVVADPAKGIVKYAPEDFFKFWTGVLILLDLLMPRFSGIDVLKAMKNDEEIRDIPVIVMTSDQEAELECLYLGVMDFIPKPYPKWEIVRARVDKCIELAEDRDMIRTTERDKLTSLFNIDYFRRYVQMFDRNDWEAPMDAVALKVENLQTIRESCGKTGGDKLLRQLGERLRTLSRELGGVGSRQGEDTFLIYCPHREDYPALLSRLSAGLSVDESFAEQVRLRMGVYPVVDKKLDAERRFENARAAADAVEETAGAPVGFFDVDAGREKE